MGEPRGRWAQLAQEAIEQAHKAMPAGVSLAERTKRIDAAYPFGQRQHFPYKAWLGVRKSYLARHGKRPKDDTPLEAFISGTGDMFSEDGHG